VSPFPAHEPHPTHGVSPSPRQRNASCHSTTWPAREATARPTPQYRRSELRFNAPDRRNAIPPRSRYAARLGPSLFACPRLNREQFLRLVVDPNGKRVPGRDEEPGPTTVHPGPARERALRSLEPDLPPSPRDAAVLVISLKKVSPVASAVEIETPNTGLVNGRHEVEASRAAWQAPAEGRGPQVERSELDNHPKVVESRATTDRTSGVRSRETAVRPSCTSSSNSRRLFGTRYAPARRACHARQF